MIFKRMFSRQYAKLNAWVDFIRSQYGSNYRFTITDCRLYIKERYWTVPAVKVSGESGDLYQLTIGSHTFYWPRDFNISGLGWLHNEVFMPWEDNPSSYGHPNLHLKECDWLIDAGACEGFFTHYAFQQGVKHVLAVEPLPVMYNALSETFRREKLCGNFFIFSGGVSKMIGEMQLSYDPNHSWDSFVSSDYTETNQILKVPATTIDTLVTCHGFQKNGFIKMDIEGGEMDALKGAKYTLVEYKPKLAVAVYHGCDNALLCRDIILDANPDYHVEFRGMYSWFQPPRPYMLFGW